MDYFDPWQINYGKIYGVMDDLRLEHHRVQDPTAPNLFFFFLNQKPEARNVFEGSWFRGKAKRKPQDPCEGSEIERACLKNQEGMCESQFVGVPL